MLKHLLAKFFGTGEGGIFFSQGQSVPPKKGTTDLLKAYNEMPWLRAVTNKISRSVALNPWYLQVSGSDEKLFDHPILDVLNAGAGSLTGLAMRQLLQIHYDLVGEAFWLKERAPDGRVVSLWPLIPDLVLDVPTPVKSFFKISAGGVQYDVPQTEVIYLLDPDSAKPFGRGSGTARALADELDTDEFAAKHIKTWFYNRARPDMIISGDSLRKEDTARLEEAWTSQTRGFWKAFKPFFLSQKVDVQTISQSFESMQLVDLRKYERDTIIQVYGVPPEILGIIENSNRATIEASDYLFSRWVIQPRLESLRAVLQRDLVDELDETLRIHFVSPIVKDKEFSLRVAQAAPWSLTIDEWREMQGREPLPNNAGKVFMMPFNLMPSSRPELELEPQVETAKDLPATIDDIESLLTKIDLEVLKRELQPQQKATVEAFGQETLDGLKDPFDMLHPGVVHFLDTEALSYIKKINRTTKNQLRKTLIEGVEFGESIPKLANRVYSVFNVARGYRATRIARTEVVRASNFGGYQGMVQGGVSEREWLATKDDRVRDDHAVMDGQRQAMGHPFNSPDGSQAMYPGDFGVAGQDINCRCTTAPILDDRSMYDTEEKRVVAWQKFDRSIRPFERRMKRAAQRAFVEQQNAVLDELERS